MDDEIQGKLVKAGTAWAAVGITSWTDAASFVAFLYSLALLTEWVWKKVIRPALVKHGYLKADRRKGERDGF